MNHDLKNKITNNLLKCGHTKERIEEIIEEAIESSNPIFILYYYGVKNDKLLNQFSNMILTPFSEN